MQEERAAVEIVLRGIGSLLEWTDSANPSRATLEQARRFTQESRNESLTCPERSALLRVASTHLKAADMEQRDRAVSEMLALTRFAMTAALFEIGPGSR